MNILFDQEQLMKLPANLYVFTGIAANIQLKGMIQATEGTDQAVPPGQGALRRPDPHLAHRPAAHRGGKGPPDPERSAHRRRGGGGGYQRLQLLFAGFSLPHRHNPQKLP